MLLCALCRNQLDETNPSNAELNIDPTDAPMDRYIICPQCVLFLQHILADEQ